MSSSHHCPAFVRAALVCALVSFASAFAIAAAAGGIAAQGTAGSVIQRPAHGFSLLIPAGWQEHVDADVAAALVPTNRQDVVLMVFVQREEAPVDVEGALAKLLTKLFQDPARKVVSNTFDVFLKRTALVAEFDDATTRYKMTLFPRDTGTRSQVFYAIMTSAPRAEIGVIGPILERVKAGFQITEMSAQAAGQPRWGLAAPPPAGTARPQLPAPATLSAPAPAARPRATMSAAERSALFDRILAPKPTEAAKAALRTAKQTDRVDGIAAYDRGFVFARQGAWTEAEKEFRTAERKDDNNPEIVFSLGYALLKQHKPDEALKRYDKVYKDDPRNTRAMVGLGASWEDRQNYREAVKIWQRYIKMDLAPADRERGTVLLRTAQDLFAQYYEIAENPGGGAVNALSAQQELALGQNAASQLAQSGIAPVRDDTINRYIQRLCQTLVSHAKKFPTNYEVYILDTADVNAFTIPGYIFINRGLLSAVDNEAELAGVLAHEIGHSVAHHSAKKLTKSAQDQQQTEQMKASNSKFMRWLGSVSESGAASGQAAFSREAEEQADRLAVHITFDSGIDPRGFASFFQKLESIDPSSRNAWDLMRRTHPFSIDRLNTVNAYIDLLPERPTRMNSDEFRQMQARLAKLPPPADATGLMRSPSDRPASPAPSTPSRSSGSGGGMATQTFTMDAVPFAGEIPAGWGGRKTPAGTIVFEGPQGTESYEVSVEFGFEPKRSGMSIDRVADAVQDALIQKSQPHIQATERQTANDGTPVRLVRGTYVVRSGRGNAVTMRHLTVVTDYTGYYVIMSYYTPETIYQKYQDVFTLIVERFHYTGR